MGFLKGFCFVLFGLLDFGKVRFLDLVFVFVVYVCLGEFVLEYY